MSLGEARALRESDPERYIAARAATAVAHVRAMVELQARAAATSSTTATTCAPRRCDAGFDGRVRLPGLRARLHPAAVLPRAPGPFRWAALSGDPDDIRRTDQRAARAVPRRRAAAALARARAASAIAFQGLPARICWLGYGDRAKAGLLFNELVRRGEVQAPIVIGRDHLDCGSVASPYRETEAMTDGSRRDRRLADPERAARHRLGRVLGEPSTTAAASASATRSTPGW